MTTDPTHDYPRMGALFAEVSDLLHLTPARYVVVSESTIGGDTNWIGYATDPQAACDAAERLASAVIPCERIVARVNGFLELGPEVTESLGCDSCGKHNHPRDLTSVWTEDEEDTTDPAHRMPLLYCPSCFKRHQEQAAEEQWNEWWAELEWALFDATDQVLDGLADLLFRLADAPVCDGPWPNAK